ncbi:MAG: hypothetical protein GY854_31095 [Deltaproteobacteria bacterium]|nr:hypothetical protein [Deltaproteobacteria bacterium]
MMTQDENRFEILKASVADIGPIRHGTVLDRFMRCGNPNCRCRADPPELHGPYYQWTRKVKGKTVSVSVTREQARLLKEWIANSRRLDKIVADMQEISNCITEPLFLAVGKPPKGS